MTEVQKAEKSISNLETLFTDIKSTGVTGEQYMQILRAIQRYQHKESELSDPLQALPTDCIRCWKLTDEPAITSDGETLCQECYTHIYTGEEVAVV